MISDGKVEDIKPPELHKRKKHKSHRKKHAEKRVISVKDQQNSDIIEDNQPIHQSLDQPVDEPLMSTNSGPSPSEERLLNQRLVE